MIFKTCYFQELVKYYQTNLLSSSFFGLETSLMTPFKGRRGSNQATQLSPPPLAPRPQPSRPPRPTPSPNHSSGYFPPHLSKYGELVLLLSCKLTYCFSSFYFSIKIKINTSAARFFFVILFLNIMFLYPSL